jgi:hypothetical protein
VICLDARGPESAKSARGPRLVPAQAQGRADGTVRPAARAPQGADDGRRGTGDTFGAFRPATGGVCTQPYGRRTAANGADPLAHVEAWLPSDGDPGYAIVDHLSAHRATDVWPFSWTHPRWAFVFRSTPPTSTCSSPGGRCCGRSPSRADASRPGPRSARPLRRPRLTGISTAPLGLGPPSSTSAAP